MTIKNKVYVVLRVIKIGNENRFKDFKDVQ